MGGMSRGNGTALNGIDHIRQSIADILTTPIGSRVMRRDYGSLLPSMIDQPLNDATLLQAYSASVMAILRWEPRVRVTAIRKSVSTTEPGRVTFEIDGVTDDDNVVALSIPLSERAS
ncbi:GPW/gp25 family protein [Salinicola socius]|uniref:Baseplate assembly protein n=2 Tax=Salinicola socius TaxID=404433 RepID=A0A1Q8SUH5_9GAMM|nr:GPW/gp25 family protein [Salinicola socius]OLO05110.1 baseplate assembly protein [Salinicola socius]